MVILIHNFTVNLIGAEGLQLFIDAGIPVDENTVRDLVEQVLLDEIRGLAGQRTAADTERVAIVQQVPAPDQTVTEVQNVVSKIK